MLKKLFTASVQHIRGMGRFFYAVRRGRQTGVFLTWDECKLQVNGFAGARYKKFGTEDDAWDFVKTTDNDGSGASKSSACHSLAVAKTVGQTKGFSSYQYKRSYSTDSPSETQPTAKRKKTILIDALPSSSDEHSSDDLVVYTDGACSRNGAHGAKAGIGVYWGDGNPLNHSSRLEGKQTNQRAELTAALKALEQIKDHHERKNVTLYTDSKYTIHCVNDWIHKWKRNGWKTSQNTDVLNKDDLVKLDKLNREVDVKWEYVPGHKNIHGNEKADQLARHGALQDLPGKNR